MSEHLGAVCLRGSGVEPKLTRGEFMICKNLRWMAALTMATSLAISPAVTLAAPGGNGDKGAAAAPSAPTTTPIKHVVVIFQENVSFDHYFGTYPNAENPEGEIKFKAKNATPAVDGL